MCWKLADLPVCLVFIRSLSPWYFSSLSENKTGDTGSQGNLERKVITVINKIWWPRHNLERLMTCQHSHPASWAALGTPQFSLCFHLAQGIYPALPHHEHITMEAELPSIGGQESQGGTRHHHLHQSSILSSLLPPGPYPGFNWDRINFILAAGTVLCLDLVLKYVDNTKMFCSLLSSPYTQRFFRFPCPVSTGTQVGREQREDSWPEDKARGIFHIRECHVLFVNWGSWLGISDHCSGMGWTPISGWWAIG